MMKTARENKAPTTHVKIDMAALWHQSMADEDFRFEIKAQAVAVDLVRAMTEIGLTQTQVAEKLGWKPSRVSRVLHGAPNLTLRTLHDFATSLNLEFDVIYRRTGQRRAPQPWEGQAMMDDAVTICRKIDSLHNTARANLTQSEVILDTARQLVHRAWSAAKVPASASTKSVQLPEREAA